MNIKSIILSAAALLAVTAGFSQPRPQASTPHLDFTTVKEVPITSIKNQYRSGTCWCYSAISFLESEILRTKGIETDLSEMFVVGHSYHDRAVKYVRLDGHLGFSAGSEFSDVLHVINDYGIVPESVYSGMNYGTELPEQAEMDAVLAAYMEAVVKNPNKVLSTAWLNGFDGILEAYLGKFPTEFEYEGKTYTPESFRDWLGIKESDYVAITSFTHHPFYEQFVMEVCDNWRWDTCYNLPLDEMMEVIYNSIDKGYSLLWGSDVSESGFTRAGTGTVPEDDETKLAAGSDQERWVGGEEGGPEGSPESKGLIEKTITQEMRQIAFDNKQTTDDHGMHLFGTAVDQNGNNFFLIKNSWGITGSYDGIWYVSDAFVRYKTINILVNKNAIPDNIKAKLGIK